VPRPNNTQPTCDLVREFLRDVSAASGGFDGLVAVASPFEAREDPHTARPTLALIGIKDLTRSTR
jgi:hypothetical protein